MQSGTSIVGQAVIDDDDYEGSRALIIKQPPHVVQSASSVKNGVSKDGDQPRMRFFLDGAARGPSRNGVWLLPYGGKNVFAAIGDAVLGRADAFYQVNGESARACERQRLQELWDQSLGGQPGSYTRKSVRPAQDTAADRFGEAVKNEELRDTVLQAQEFNDREETAQSWVFGVSPSDTTAAAVATHGVHNTRIL